MRSWEILKHALYARWWIVLKAETKTSQELGVDPDGLVLFLSWFNILDNSPFVLEATWSSVEVPQFSGA